MKAYIAIKYHQNHANRARIEAITAALEASGFTTYCVTRDLEVWGNVHFDPQTLMQKSFQIIESSDLLVADITEKGVGVGIEAGYAWAQRIPIVTIAQTSASIPETLRGISSHVTHYEHEHDLIASFEAVRKACFPHIENGHG